MILRVMTLALLVPLTACAFKGANGEPGGTNGSVWRPHPAAARVYPSTRFARFAEGTMLEARIELLDEMGDSIKGAGEFRLELFAPAVGRAAEEGRDPGRRLYTWETPLHTLAQQRQFYDPVTRTYQFRLRMDVPSHAGSEALLRVTFLAADGERLQAEAVVDPLK